jgi:hypothetical protein
VARWRRTRKVSGPLGIAAGGADYPYVRVADVEQTSGSGSFKLYLDSVNW